MLNVPTDAELSIIANGDEYLIRSLRQLFQQAGATSDDADGISLSAGNAEAAANQAIAAINRLADAISVSPPRIFPSKYEDLSPRHKLSHTDSLADLAPI